MQHPTPEWIYGVHQSSAKRNDPADSEPDETNANADQAQEIGHL
jgi:hypothetical protein